MPAFMIRDKRHGDIAFTHAVTRAAFETMPYSQQTEAAITRLREIGGPAGVVVGDTARYERFGFVPGGSLSYPDLPGDFCRVLSLGAGRPVGVVAFHTGFPARDD